MYTLQKMLFFMQERMIYVNEHNVEQIAYTVNSDDDGEIVYTNYVVFRCFIAETNKSEFCRLRFPFQFIIILAASLISFGLLHGR